VPQKQILMGCRDRAASDLKHSGSISSLGDKEKPDLGHRPGLTRRAGGLGYARRRFQDAAEILVVPTNRCRAEADALVVRRT
jgi:hypothetical protein